MIYQTPLATAQAEREREREGPYWENAAILQDMY